MDKNDYKYKDFSTVFSHTYFLIKVINITVIVLIERLLCLTLNKFSSIFLSLHQLAVVDIQQLNHPIIIFSY